ncbi:hypothetical protein [Haloferax volcanii]|uniref:hypothetical protein n=1 Tax=Haloferax volcanii TaxID=2246 RepID=UPI0038598884
MTFQPPIPDAMVGAVAGAIVGSVGTFVAGEISRRKKEKKTANRIRTALIYEIYTVSNLASQVQEFVNNDQGDFSEKDAFSMLKTVVHKDVYSANSDKISLLSEPEISHIVVFYTTLNRFSKTAIENTGTSEDTSEMLSELLSRVTQKGEECVKVLDENR